MVQTAKNLPAMWETSVQSLGWEDPLEKGEATYSRRILEDPGESPQTEETGGLQSMGSQRARHSSKHTHMYHFKHVQHFYYLPNGFQFGFKSSFMWVHESDENESYSVMSDSL